MFRWHIAIAIHFGYLHKISPLDKIWRRESFYLSLVRAVTAQGISVRNDKFDNEHKFDFSKWVRSSLHFASNGISSVRSQQTIGILILIGLAPVLALHAKLSVDCLDWNWPRGENQWRRRNTLWRQHCRNINCVLIALIKYVIPFYEQNQIKLRNK